MSAPLSTPQPEVHGAALVILAHVFVSGVVWFIAAGDRLHGHGVAQSFSELRMVQVRAGIAQVAIFAYLIEDEIEAAIATHAGEWRRTTASEIALMENFFAQASREIAKSGIGARTVGA